MYPQTRLARRRSRKCHTSSHDLIASVREATQRLDSREEMTASYSQWEAETEIVLRAAPALREVLQNEHVYARWVEAETLAIAERVLAQDLAKFQGRLRFARWAALSSAEAEADRRGLKW